MKQKQIPLPFSIEEYILLKTDFDYGPPSLSFFESGSTTAVAYLQQDTIGQSPQNYIICTYCLRVK